MVSRVIGFLYREVKGLHQAAYILALFTLGSQALAIVRDRTLAHQFGASETLDIYYAAFRIPDVLFVLFASVLSVYVLLPFVVRAHEKNKQAAQELLSSIFTWFVLLYIAIATLVWIAAPYLASFLFPGFTETVLGEVVAIMRILLLQPLLLGLSSLAGVVTQMHNRFVVYAVSPILYNLGIIFGAVFLVESFGVTGLAFGVLIGAFLHMAIQLPLLWRYEIFFYPRLTFPLKELKAIMHIAVPRALTLTLGQLQFMFFVALASLMAVGSVSVLQFAYNLQSVPLAIIGVSYSVAAFPVLTTLYTQAKTAEFQQYILSALRHIIFWSIPALFLIVVLRAHIVRLVLGSGQFDWDATRLTAAVLALFAFTLTIQCVLLVLLRALYAGSRVYAPLIITAIGVICGALSAYVSYVILTTQPTVTTAVANLLRVSEISGVEVLAIPFGFMVGILVELLIMVVVAARVFTMSFTSLLPTILKSLIASTGGAVATYATLQFVVEGVNQAKFMGVFLQGVTAAIVGVLTIAILFYLLKSKEFDEVVHSSKNRLRRFKEPYIKSEN